MILAVNKMDRCSLGLGDSDFLQIRTIVHITLTIADSTAIPSPNIIICKIQS